MHTVYRRPKLIEDDEEGISDYVKVRLLMARLKAMEKYDEVHSLA